jgi:hypothetical protein
MTYTPQTWNDFDPTKPVSAARMTHIEDGIAATATVADGSSNASNITSGTLAAARVGDLSGLYATVAGAARNPLTGWFHPEGNGTITYGKGVTQAQAQANAAAVQAAIDAANNGGGVAANTAGGGIVDIRDVIEVYTASAVSALTLYSGVHLVGHGIGGDVFSGTDANLPYRASVLRLWSGANQDLIRTANFATLTGQSSPSAYATPSRFGLHNLVLDGNKSGNSSGIPLRIFGRSYRIEHVTIQNGAAGGVYSEYGSGGYEMEARWNDFTITDCAGKQLEWRGPHDSQFVNGTVGHPDAAATHGIQIVQGAYVGGEQFSNVHVWGTYATHWWEIGTSNGYFTNCTSDGNGITFTGSGNTWSGTIYGTLTPGQYAVKMGDTVSRTIGQNTIRGRVFNFKGSPYAVQTLTTNTSGNRFQATANMGGESRYQAKGLPATLSGAAIVTDTTLNLVTTANLPTTSSGTSGYASDGTNRTSTLAWTGKTGTTLTGVTGLPAGGLASGAVVFLQSLNFGTGDFGNDSFEVIDYDSPTSFGLWRIQSTPNANANHNAIMRVSGRVFADEGTIIANNSGGIGSLLKAGSGLPTFSGTAGDYYFRTDTPSTSAQRLYICTGTTNWIPVITPSPMEVVAGGMGFLWENYSRNAVGSSSALVSGTAYFSLFAAMPGKTLTGLAFDVITAGSGQTLVRAAVCDATTGAIVAQSADEKVTFQGTGIKVATLTSSVSVTVPTAYYAVLIGVGGTQPFLSRGNASTDAQRYGSNAYSFGRLTGQTDIPTTGPNAGSGQALWVAGVGT